MFNVGLASGRKASRKSKAVMFSLFVVLCAVCARLAFQGPSRAQAKSPKSTAPEPIKVSNPQRPVERLGAIELDWSLDLQRDPFVSSVVFPPAIVVENGAASPADKAEEVLKAARRTIKLTGTFTGANPLAIINGRTYQAGDRVEGFSVKQIGDREVVLEKDGISLVVVSE